MNIFLQSRICQKLSPPCSSILQVFSHVGERNTPKTTNRTLFTIHQSRQKVAPIIIIHDTHQISSSLLSPPKQRRNNILFSAHLFKYFNIIRKSHSTTLPLHYNCWKCGKEIMGGSELGYLLCPSCGSPQPLVGVVGVDNDKGPGPSFYDLLSHPKSYAVDLEKLAATAKRLQKRLHPDLFAQKGKKEQDLSQELSSLINKAYSTLANPIQRGRYLLELHGIKDPIGDIEKEITSDPTFLEEVMELNERLEELDSEQDWRQFRTTNDIVLQQIQSELDVAFKANKIGEAKILLARMKYYDTLQGKLKELKTKLNIVE